MKVSEKIELDLTKPFANVGTPIDFCEGFVLDNGLLPYPDARLICATLNAAVTFTNPDVEVDGSVTVEVSGNCDRCLTPVNRQIKLPFHEVFFKDSAEEDGYSYEGSKLDLHKALSDAIATGLPTLLLCKEDCKGLCPKCGANKNLTDCGCDTAKENAFSVLKNLKF